MAKRHTDCAVLFAAPRLGCVVSSRVPGRRDATLHEHAWSHTLPKDSHSGFPVKIFQPSLNSRLSGHESHVSGTFYRFNSVYVAWSASLSASVVVSSWQYQSQTIQHHPGGRLLTETHSTNAIYPMKHIVFLWKITSTVCNFVQPFKLYNV